MLAFDACHDYRRPSEADPNAAQPIPDTRELMGLSEKGHGHTDSNGSSKEQEAPGARDRDLVMIEIQATERICSECGAVSYIGENPCVVCHQL